MREDLYPEISYGKQHIPVYLVYEPSPNASLERSSHTRSRRALSALEIDIEVLGKSCLAAYTRADNSLVVATDTMKNFVLQNAQRFRGTTLESFLFFLGQRFLSTYSQMGHIRLSGRERIFTSARGHHEGECGSINSGQLFHGSRSDHYTAMLEMERDEYGGRVIAHRCGYIGLQLIKIRGSAFSGFLRDQYTTLSERSDRPLFISLNTYWRYRNVDDLLCRDHCYIGADAVLDRVRDKFDSLVSESIQHLVYEMGIHILDHFIELGEVAFEAQNRTWEPVREVDGERAFRVYSEPHRAYGEIKLSLTRTS